MYMRRRRWQQQRRNWRQRERSPNMTTFWTATNLFPLLSRPWALLITVESTLSKTLTLHTGDIRETAFLFQHLSTTIQRFNMVAFHCTFDEPDTTERVTVWDSVIL